MRAEAVQTGPCARPAHDGRDRAAAQAHRRRHRSDEHRPRRRTRAAALQVVGDRRPHVARQRQHVGASALAAHRDLPRAPVEILELQSRDLVGPKPQAQHQHDHRVVPPSHGPAPVTGVQQCPCLGPAQSLRQQRDLAPRDRHRRRRQIAFDQPREVGVAQERAHRAGVAAHRRRRVTAAGLAQDRSADIVNSQPAKTLAAAAVQEPSSVSRIRLDGQRRHAALLTQVVDEPGQRGNDLLARRSRRSGHGLLLHPRQVEGASAQTHGYADLRRQAPRPSDDSRAASA